MEKLSKKLFLVSVLLSFSSLLLAQRPKPSEWEIKFSKSEVKPGDSVTIFLIGSIPDHQSVYASNYKCQVGPLPAQLIFLNSEVDYFVKDTLRSVGEKKEYDEIFECYFTKFKGKAVLKQTLVFKEKEPLIKAYFEYQTCTDQLCMMYSLQIELKGTKVLKMENGQ